MHYLNVYYIYSEKEVQTYHLLNHSQTVNNLFFFFFWKTKFKFSSHSQELLSKDLMNQEITYTEFVCQSEES